MKIVVCHNYYRDRGGEDQVFEDEVQLLRSRGHDVTTFIRRNDDFSGLGTVAVAAGTIWNRSTAAALEKVVEEQSADIVHFHNWLPQISQGAFHVARRAGAAVVQTVHNYRLACVTGVLYRDGKVCEECIGRSIGWPAIKHGCYRGSRAATIPVVAAVATHRAIRTSDRVLDAIIVLSEFARSKLISAGLPPRRVHIKPNFVVQDPGERDGGGGYFVYLGRLTEEKGVDTLIEAWSLMENPPVLKIAGAGPMTAVVEDAAAANDRIDYVGHISPTEIPDFVGSASFSIAPSTNYEGFPKVIVESFAVGTPVIASDIGSLTELIDSSRTGFLVKPGDPAALATVVREIEAGTIPEGMRRHARNEYLSRYNVDENYDQLMRIYDSAIAARSEIR